MAEPSEPANQLEELQAVRKELAKLNAHRFIRMHNSLPRLIGFNFLRGLAFGFGTFVGATFVLSMIVWSLSQIEFVPIIGGWASEVAQIITETLSAK